MVGGSSPFPAAPPHSSNLASSTANDAAIRRGSLRDITSVVFGNPNALPGPPASHFFPSVPKAKRDQQRAARLATSSPAPPLPSSSSVDHPRSSSTVHPSHHHLEANGQSRTLVGSPSSNEDEAEFEQRQRSAKYELASHGPFPSTSSPFPTRSNPASLREGSSTSATPTLKSVGGGGSHGTKRRHREAAERTSWDAASELVRIEREREKVIDRWGHEVSGATNGREILGEGTRKRERSTREGTVGSSPIAGTDSQEEDHRGMSIAGSMAGSQIGSPQDVDMDEGEEDGEGEEDDFDEDDGASIATFKTGASTKSKGKNKSVSGESGPAKKRSRTLTTPAQTAVLNALLAKTRFPSTETREEVGAQIGMSARRVQIWFQNRRQSQKRVRDREVQDASVSSMPTNASNHSLPLSHGVPVHPHYPYGPPTVDPYAAHRYPLNGQSQVHPHLQSRYGAPPQPSGPYQSAAPSASQHSLHHMQQQQHHQQQQQQQRPEISRQPSMDSLASRNSFVSAVSAAPPAQNGGSRKGDGLGPLPSESRYNHPYATQMPFNRVQNPLNQRSAVASPTTYQPHSSSIGPQPSQGSSKLYFPHVSRGSGQEQSSGTSMRMREDSTTSVASSVAGDVKLPSLSALLNTPSQQRNGPSNIPNSHQTQSSHSNYPPSSQTSQNTEHSRPSVTPISHQPSFTRAIFSPPPSTSFERLRISGPMSPGPPQAEQIPTTSTSPFAFHPPPLAATQPTSAIREASPDILDVAMDTMAYRPAGRSLPPRSTLPPLRSVFGDSTFPTKPRGGSKTEADKALMAPILPSMTGSIKLGSNGGPPRLAPISTFPITLSVPGDALSPTSRSGPSYSTPTPAYLNASTRASTVSEASTAQTRSSVASFDFRHPPTGSTRDRYQQQYGGGGWPSIVGGGAAGSGGPGSNGGSTSSPRHRSSVGSSARTSISSEHEK